jgi:hypothetical protein
VVAVLDVHEPYLENMNAPERLFVLSPATLAGARGRRILGGDLAVAPFMERLASGGDVPLADVYAVISSLYFRGKLGYARRFARRRGVASGVLAVTPNRGLVPADHPVSALDLRMLARTSIDPAEPGYVEPLLESARALHRELGGDADVVLLGSIATDKYVGPLASVFSARLLVPRSFVGRGDMSRGALLLRAAAAGRELEYVAALEAPRRGPRPPKVGDDMRTGGNVAPASGTNPPPRS